MPSNKKKQSSTLPPMLSNETVKLHSPRRARGSSSVVPGRGQAALAGATASETSPDFTCHILAAASPLLPRLAALPFKLAIALSGPRPRPGFSRLALGVVRAILRRHSQVLPLPAFLSSGLTGQRLGLSCFARAAAGIRTPRPGRRRPVGLQGE